MANLNSVHLIGRLSRDVELKYSQTGTAVGKFSLATNEVYKSKDGSKNEETTFHNIVAFGKTAELCSQYLVKGREVFISGKISNRSYEAKDGTKKYISEVKADAVQFLSAKNSDAPAQQTAPVQAKPNLTPEFDTSFSANDIPFSKVEFC